MTRSIDAIYENGVLRPLEPIEGIPDHGKVKLALISENEPHPLLRFAGILSDEDAADMLKIIEEEFEQVDPNDWK
jgi:predicted DNA-binding antitoxin AbrB/MazE fold protein